MCAAPEIFHKHRVDFQDCIFVPLGPYHISHRQSSHIRAVFEIYWIERLQTHLVKDLSTLRPFRKDRRGRNRNRSRNVWIFVVFLGSTDDRILHHIFDGLLYLGFRKGNVHDQSRPIMNRVLVTMRGKRRRNQQQ
jgi:hypothetical protein